MFCRACVVFLCTCMVFLNVIREDVLLGKKLHVILSVALLSLRLSSAPSQIICLQFLGFTVVVVVFSWSFWKRSLYLKGVLSENRRHFGNANETYGCLFCLQCPHSSPYLQLPFSSIFWVSKWFYVYSLPLLHLMEPPQKALSYLICALYP